MEENLTSVEAEAAEPVLVKSTLTVPDTCFI